MQAASGIVMDRQCPASHAWRHEAAEEAPEREAMGRLWTPPVPAQLLDSFVELDPSATRLLWAAWCVPPRYRLSPALWRKEARIASIVALKAKLRRLVQADLTGWRDVRGRGLVFDGQTWRPRPYGQASFWELRLTPVGESRVRQSLQHPD